MRKRNIRTYYIRFQKRIVCLKTRFPKPLLALARWSLTMQRKFAPCSIIFSYL